MTRLCLVGLLAIFAGCAGTERVLKEDTEATAELIDAALTATRTFYDELGEKQFDYMIDFLVERPSCNAENPLLYMADEGRCFTSDEKTTWRECQDAANTDSVCPAMRRILPIPLSPQTLQKRQTLVTLLASVASYQRALNKVLNDETFNTADELKDLNSRINELRNRIGELKGDSTASSDTTDELDKQLEAVGALVDLLREVGEDRADYEKLKTIVTDNGPAINTALENLLRTYELVDKPISDNFVRRRIEIARRAYNTMPLDDREELEPEEREEILRGIYEPEAERLRNAARPDALAAGLRGLIRSHKQLQQGFAGNLTSEQRRRIAKENQQQLKAVFKSMLSIVKLFS